MLKKISDDVIYIGFIVLHTFAGRAIDVLFIERHIELARPMYHVGFIKEVKTILDSVYFHCGKLKADVKTNILFRERY